MEKPRLKDKVPDELEPLNPAEERLLNAAQDGKPLFLTVDDKGEPRRPDAPEDCNDTNTIRAKVIEWLCTDKEAKELVSHKGIQVAGAKIIGTLNLQFADIRFPLTLFYCVFDDKVILLHAKVRALNLNSGHTKAILADGLKTDGNVFLADKFYATGEVRLNGADIGGQLNCREGKFENPATKDNKDARALNATNVKVNGSVLLDQKFHAEGEVRLNGANIGGQLDCSGGRFVNKNGHALNAAGLKVNGNVFLRDKFHATGGVRLLNADIGGDLSCTDGSFGNPADKENKGAWALNAAGAKVSRNVFLSECFQAYGGVSLVGAEIGGQLNCCGGRFENPATEENKDALALCADNVKVKGCVFLNEGFLALGVVRLPGADISGDLNCGDGRFKNEDEVALCAERMKVEGNFTWETRERPIGAIDLMHARVGQLSDNKESWPENGGLFIDGFEYEALAPDATPKTAEERLEWIRLQYPRQPEKTLWQKIAEFFNYKNKPTGITFIPQPYEQLAKVLRNMGHESDARKVLIAKQEDLYEYGELKWWSKAWNWIIGRSIGHGWKPWNALIILLCMMAFGSHIFLWADDLKLMAHSKKGLYMSQNADGLEVVSPSYPRFEPITYTLDITVPFLNLHQENYWLPDASKPSGQWFRFYLWLHIISGWVFSTLAALSLTGIVRKE